MVETVYNVENAPRLALLSDLHNREFGDIIASLERHRPELICIAGDVVDGHNEASDQSNVLPFLKSCAGIAPTYMSLGNHERILDDLRAFEETGVTFLDNTYQTVMSGERALIIGGLTSARVCRREQADDSRVVNERAQDPNNNESNKRKTCPETDWLQGYAAERGFHILLSHHPEYFPLIPTGIELTLSGHAHGGQWRFFGHGVFAPGQGLLPKYTSGIYEEAGKIMVVGRGLANTAPVPRINNPTEIVYVE